MKAIILAAGRGSRMLSLTDDRPKCLVELKGKPLLHWQLEALRGAGIADILVVRGYLKDRVAGDFQVTENPRWHETNMVASLMAARDWLCESPCIVSYSDIIYPSAAVERLLNTSQTAPLAILYDLNWLKLWEQRFNDPLIDAESFVQENGILKDIGRSGVRLEEIQGQYMGLLKFSPQSATWMSELLDKNQNLCDKLDMTALLRLLIENGKEIMAIPWDGKWCEVDNRVDLEVAEKIFRWSD